MAEKLDAGTLGCPLAVPASAAGHDERRCPRDRAVGGDQPAVILPSLQRPDREYVARFDALGEGPRGGQRRRSLGDRMDAVGQPGVGIAVEKVRSRCQGGHQHRLRFPQRRRQDRAEVGTLLPGHLIRPEPEGEVVDEECRRGRPGPASGGRRPVRVEDGVQPTPRFDRREPEQLVGDLMAVGREHRLVAMRQPGHALLAAEDGEALRPGLRQQCLAEGDGVRDHADARPPAGGEIDPITSHAGSLRKQRSSPALRAEELRKGGRAC